MDLNDTNGNSILLSSQISSQQQIAIGLYLLFVGVLGTVTNGVILAAFAKFPNLLSGGHRALLANLCLSDLGMCLFGFPFSASSSFANEWLYGDAGCQMYAFLGFLFGSASICSIMMLALDRYLVFCKRSSNKKYAASGRYRNMLIVIWCYAIFWSVMPLIGWASYNYEPMKTTCTIDWRQNDMSYKSFVVTYFLAGFVLPIVVMAFSYYKTTKGKPEKQNSLGETEWANEMDSTKLSVLLVIAFAFFWSAYAVVCLWSVFKDPSTIPIGLSVLPPLLAKASTIFNPLLYVIVEKQLRTAIFSFLTGSDARLHSSEDWKKAEVTKIPASRN